MKSANKIPKASAAGFCSFRSECTIVFRDELAFPNLARGDKSLNKKEKRDELASPIVCRAMVRMGRPQRSGAMLRIILVPGALVLFNG